MTRSDQMALQAEAKRRAKHRADRRWEKQRARRDVSANPAVKHVIHAFMAPMTEALEKWFRKSNSGHAGRQMNMGKELSKYSPDLLSYLACKEILNHVITRTTVTTAAIRLGKAIEDEARMALFKKVDPKAFRRVTKEIRTRELLSADHQAAYYKKVMRTNAEDNPALDWVIWSQAKRGQIGYRLLRMFCDETKAARYGNVQRGKQTERQITPAPVLFQWIEDNRNNAILLPDRLPMVVPPVDWDDLSCGGYLEYEDPLIKHAVPQSWEDHEKLLQEADMTTTLNALHVLQNTPYKVNTKVLRVMRKVWARKDAVGKLPPSEHLPPIEYPAGALSRAEGGPNDAHVGYCKQERNRREENRRRDSQILAVERVLEMAQKFTAYPKLYFPHQLDFRGRFYSLPTDLQPQASDYSRALLHFAEGKPVDTAEALGWLMVHGANCYGEDKCSMEERITWVKENGKRILYCAKEPMRACNYDFWTKADKPFMFLAWCFDYWGVLRGQDSHIAIAMDGSCNGLQHFAALLRDPVAAKAVNLDPQEFPQDIYGEVAEVVIGKLRRARGQKKLWAREFLRIGIDRKTCKRSVMVMPYGGTLHATKKYVEEELGPKITDEFGDQQLKAMHWLSTLVYDSTHEVVQSAAVAMDWLREVAKIASDQGHHVHWTTPNGFVALQRYVKQDRVIINTYLNGSAVTERRQEKGSRIQFRLNEPTNTIDRKRSINGISPNFVHSLDACALALTVERAGLDSLMMVHDDYGTHAADASKLARVLREVFVEMYAGKDLLKNFKKEVEKQIGCKLPEPPRPRGFDVKKVLKSRYFFA